MAKRASITLVLVTGQKVTRADFGRAPEWTSSWQWQSAALDGAGLRQAVSAALAAGPRCGREVWVLTDQVWTQRLYFSTAVMDGLDNEQLQRAMGFEVESFSGIPALHSRLGVRRLGVGQGTEAFWVAQIQDDVAGQVAKVVGDAGGTLRGIVHPGGLPVALASAAKAAHWSRIEVWGRATLCIEKTDEQAAQVRIINADPSQPQWHESVEAWLSRVTQPSTEWFAPAGPQEMPEGLGLRDGAPMAAERLRQVPPLAGEALSHFLRLWVQEASSLSPGVPVIVPPAVLPRMGRLAAVAAILLTALVLGCGIHHYLFRRQLDAAQDELAALDRESRQNAAVASQITDLRKVLRQQESVSPTRDVKADGVRVQQQRWPSLLAAISRSAGSVVVVDRVSCESGKAVAVDGRCTTAMAGDELAAALSQSLAAKGWAVGAAEKWRQAEDDDSGLWHFRIRVTPQLPSSDKAPPRGEP